MEKEIIRVFFFGEIRFMDVEHVITTDDMQYGVIFSPPMDLHFYHVYCALEEQVWHVLGQVGAICVLARKEEHISGRYLT